MQSVAIKQNLFVGSGETFDLNITYLDSDQVPVDLTGHSVDLIVNRAGTKDNIGTYPATVDDMGNIAIHVTDEITDEWPVSKLAYIVNHTDPDGNEKWLVIGSLTVTLP